jgi:glycosyltransferase involved in cell wall biosynthesis
MPDIHVPNAEPKVSVLMVTYNHENFIAQAIESVLMQKTDFPFELVIGDDCSTDGTREIVREYSLKYPGIIRAVLRERNIGARENFRQVFLASRGRYLALLEGDDYWTDSRKLQLLADVLDAHPETAICGHRTIRHDEDGARPDKVIEESPPGFYDLEAMLPRCFLHTSSVMFRRVIEEPPAWCSHLLMGDLPLFVEVARHGNICFLDECMAVYRVHGGGVWSGLDDIKRSRNNLALYQAYYDNLEPKYRPAIRKGLCNVVFETGLAQFAAGRPDQARQSLREYFGLCGPFEGLPEKALLALKGYGWWIFPFWRQARRLWRRQKA